MGRGGPHRARGANSIEMRDRENGMRGKGGRIYESTNRRRERGVRDPSIIFFGEKYLTLYFWGEVILNFVFSGVKTTAQDLRMGTILRSRQEMF